MKRHEKPVKLTALFLCVMSAMGCAAAEVDDAEPDTMEAASAFHLSGIASFEALHSGKCLDIRGSSLIDSARLIEFPCNGHGNQLFQISSTREAQYYEIRALHSGKCLDVRGASLNDGAAIVQFECNKQYNQQFSLERTGDGSYAIKPRHSGKCLEVRPGLLAYSDPLIQSTCNGQPNQQFKIKFFR
jgi:hypothetical protein